VSEQQAEQSNADLGSVEASPSLPAASEVAGEASAAAAVALSVLEAPAIAPDHEAPKMEAPKTDAPKAEAKAEASKLEPSKMEPAKLEVSKPDTPRASGKVLIMAPGDRVWRDHSASPKLEPKLESNQQSEKQAAGAAPKRGFVATAAMLLVATMAGAIGGALATSGFSHVADATAAPPSTGALEASIARIDSDILALKAGLEHTTKMDVSQFNKTSDRLDKIEKAQAEPNAKLAKLTEAVEKLRTAPTVMAAAASAPAPAPVATAVAAPKDVTGSVTAPQGAAPLPVPAASPAAATPPKVEVARLPTVEGWSLADVGYGGALIRSRRGTFEIYPGDYVPGLGRIDAVRKQDGQWVVVTSKGLITR
jgi:hypothetical protein